MNKLATTLGIALLGLSFGFGVSAASAESLISINIGGHGHGPGGRGHAGNVPPPGQVNHFPGQAGHFPGQASDNGIRCIRAPCDVHVNRPFQGQGGQGQTQADRNDAAAKQRHDDAVKQIQAKHEADIAAHNANLKPGEKPIRSTGKLKVSTLGDKQVAACQKQVAIQFVNKSGGVTSVAEANRRQAQCVTMFRD